MIEFNNETDFFWYKRKMELEHKEVLDHYYEPKSYPCRILKSEYSYNDNGKDAIYYSFIYRQIVKCEHCGQSKLVWPEVEEK